MLHILPKTPTTQQKNVSRLLRFRLRPAAGKSKDKRTKWKTECLAGRLLHIIRIFHIAASPTDIDRSGTIDSIETWKSTYCYVRDLAKSEMEIFFIITPLFLWFSLYAINVRKGRAKTDPIFCSKFTYREYIYLRHSLRYVFFCLDLSACVLILFENVGGEWIFPGF